MKTLKFSSRKDWTVTDFRFFLHQLNVLYNRLYVITKPSSGRAGLDNMLRGSHSRVPERDRLSIDYIEIHSPGGYGFSGYAKAIDIVRSFMNRISLHDLERKEREQRIAHQGEMNELELEEKRVEIDGKRIENAEKLVELYERKTNLMETMKFSKEEIENNIGKIVGPHRNVLMMMESHEMDLLDDGEDA